MNATTAPQKQELGLLPGVGPAATLLFIHAHPDDETIVTGATMARYAALGARVALLTCTRGELGEVIPPELAHLEVGVSGADGTGLAEERERELAGALAALGVREHYWLGSGLAGTGTDTLYRDSGMQWGPDGRAMAASTVLPGSLSKAPLDALAGNVAQLIRQLRPDAVITYAADGGYGHPDHVRTHEIALRAMELAAQASDNNDDGGGGSGGHGTPAVPNATTAHGTPAAHNPNAWLVPHAFTIVSDRPQRATESSAQRVAVDGDMAAKTAAMRAHRTQITVDGTRYALSDNVWKSISGREEFQHWAWDAA